VNEPQSCPAFLVRGRAWREAKPSMRIRRPPRVLVAITQRGFFHDAHRGARFFGSSLLDPAPVSSRWTGIAKSGTLATHSRAGTHRRDPKPAKLV
jgi:hypothetical protein